MSISYTWLALEVSLALPPQTQKASKPGVTLGKRLHPFLCIFPCDCFLRVINPSPVPGLSLPRPIQGLGGTQSRLAMGSTLILGVRKRELRDGVERLLHLRLHFCRTYEPELSYEASSLSLVSYTPRYTALWPRRALINCTSLTGK